MASKRALRKKTCERKRPLSAEEANRLVRLVRSRGGDGKPINAYKCPFSGSTPHYHVGHPPYRVRENHPEVMSYQ